MKEKKILTKLELEEKIIEVLKTVYDLSLIHI